MAAVIFFSDSYIVVICVCSLFILLFGRGRHFFRGDSY